MDDFRRRWSASQKGSRRIMCNGMDGLVHHCKGRLRLFAYEILLRESLAPSLGVCPYSKSSTIHYSESTSAQHRGIARKHLFPTVVSFRQIVYRLLIQLYCLVCAPESASRVARLSRAVCFSVSDCVCARCASSCLPSLPLPPCDALARSW